MAFGRDDGPPHPESQRQGEATGNAKSITVFQGTCGWTGQQLATWEGKRRRPSSSDSKKPLRLYAGFWPAVEINSSNYAIPTPETVDSWCKQVPSGDFRFTFKAFSLFTHRQVDPKALPADVKALLSDAQRATNSVKWSALSKQAQDLVWETFNESLITAYKHSTAKLGIIAMFQFQLNFPPTAANLRHIFECRRRLDYRLAMAVEFRDRAWFIGEAKKQLNLLQQLRDRGIALVAADELHHETFPGKNAKAAGSSTSQGPSHGNMHNVLPICMDVTNSEYAYCRIHRRTGFEDRRLSRQEIQQWRDRIATMASRLDNGGIIFVFWGTEHRNEPLNNGKNLAKALEGVPGVVVAQPDTTPGRSETSIERYFPFMGIRKT